MSGILDILGLGSGAPSGILAGTPSPAPIPSPWASRVGLLGSTLQDVGANLSGHPADADHLQAFARLNAQRQLLSAIGSPDPTIRQKAYSAAQAMGIDTAPFRQQAAAAAMPDLLNALKPQFNSVQVTPQITAPGQYAQRAAAGAYSGPAESTPTLSDALSSVNSPELSAQMAPDIIKETIARQEKAATTLSPQQVSSAGFKPGTIVQQDAYGNLKVVQPSDLKSDAAVQQQIALENANPQLAISRAQLGVSQGNLDLARQKQQDSLIDPLTRQQMAQQYLAGDPSVLTGLARGNPANIPLVRAEIQRQANALGMKGGDIATKMAEFKGLTAGERALGTRTAQVGLASNEFAPMAAQAQTAMTELGPSGFMPLAKLEQAYQKNTNDPRLAKAVAANNAVINTYARLINPTGVPTDSDKQHARDMLSTAQSLPAYVAALNQMRAEGAIAKTAPGQARSELGNLFSGNAAPVTAAVPPSPVTLPRVQSAPMGKIRIWNPATGALEPAR